MQLHTVFTPPQVESESSVARLGRITPGEKNPGISLKCGWLAPSRCGDLYKTCAGD